MDTNSSRLRANAPEWTPREVNAARSRLVKKLKKMFRTQRNNRVLIPRSEAPVYNALPVSEEAFNKALMKMENNMVYNKNLKNTLKEANLNRRWNEPAENNETPITKIVRNIQKTARENINAAEWEELNKNIQSARTRKARKTRKTRKAAKAARR